RRQAETAMKDDDVKKAIKYYNQYLKYRPEDADGYTALAELVLRVADEDGTRQNRAQAYNTLETAIRKHPDLEGVRRRLVDYTIANRRFIDALDHIKYLNDHGIDDASLQYKVAFCQLGNGDEEKCVRKLEELVGYDSEAQQFNPDPPGKSEISAFELLAQLL